MFCFSCRRWKTACLALLITILIIGLHTMLLDNTKHKHTSNMSQAAHNLTLNDHDRILQNRIGHMPQVLVNSTVAVELTQRVRVLCWVMTQPKNAITARFVKHTWGRRCNKLIFFSSEKDEKLGTVVVHLEETRNHLTGKTMHAFKYIYDNYINDFEWFMKADDDTYVILENLRFMLAEKDPNDPVYFGHHFKTIVPQGYFSGGAGYVLSQEALRRFGNTGFHVSGMCREDGGAEDAEMGWCMERLGVKVGDSYDKKGRSRFHCFNPVTHVVGGYPDWYHVYDSHGALSGLENMSEHPISFHYISQKEMHLLEFFTYHMLPYGVVSKDTVIYHTYYKNNTGEKYNDSPLVSSHSNDKATYQ